jgi:hypothetical protein
MSADLNFNLDSFAGLQDAAKDAHDEWRRGDFAAALTKYAHLVGTRLSLAVY